MNQSIELTKVCPFCAEEIKASAILCRFCQSDLSNHSKDIESASHSFTLGRCIHCGIGKTNADTYKLKCKPATAPAKATALAPPPRTMAATDGPTVTPAKSAVIVSNQSASKAPASTSLRCPKCASTAISAHKKGFGLAKAIVGDILLGPVGILAGFHGSRKVQVSCLKCGHAWAPGK